MITTRVFPAFATLLVSAAMAMDPPAPPGGFPITYDPDKQIIYSDGYRTLLDVRYPSVAPPPTGWPCAVVVHGGGGNRNRSWVITVAEKLAGAGYVTLAYDTGNNGVTVNNPGGTRPEELRLRDLAEIIHLAELNLGPVMDHTRLAVMGKSGGGKHALWAASYSGKPLPVAGFVTHMPVFLAVHSDIQVVDPIEDDLPTGSLIEAEWAVKQYQMFGAADPVVQMMLSSNYAGLRAYLQTKLNKNYFSLLQQSDVPVFVSYAYDDEKHWINVNADKMPQLKPGVPRRYFQATGGHGSQGNAGIGSLRRDYTVRWFDRFLKGTLNHVDQEPYAEIGMIPADAAAYQNFGTEWKHRQSDTWPILPSRRLYMRTGGQLDSAPPTAIENGPVIEHRVAAGYDMLAFMAETTATGFLGSIPLVTKSFDTPPMTEPQEIVGRTVVELDVINSAANCQLQAALLDVPPVGAPRFITSGVGALRQAIPGRHRMRIELGDTGYILRPGHKLRLSLENINMRRQPGHQYLFVMPDFANCDIDVQIDPAFAPRVELPMRPAHASLTPRFGRVSAGPGYSYDLNIHGEASRAGDIYHVFLGASGSWPGTMLSSRVPLNIDALTFAGVALVNQAPLFQAFAGILDAQGEATATFALPAPASSAFVGLLRLTFAVIGIEAGPVFYTANPAELIIEP